MGRKTDADPTGQKANRKNASVQLRNRLKKAMHSIIDDVKFLKFAVVRQKPVVNAGVGVYVYDLSSDELESLALSVQSHLDSELGTFKETMPIDWWYKKQVELPYRQGTLEELVDINQALSTVASGSAIATATTQLISEAAILFSAQYLDGVRLAQIRNYNLIKTLSADTAKKVLLDITNDIQAGLPIQEIQSNIRKNFSVSESNAKRIAATEVNRAYNDARLQAVELAAKESDQEFAVVHISSLLPTTRDNHAARHNKVYSVTDQTRWWNEGANRINCHCTTRSVLIREGRVVQSELQRRIRK
jgi:SPP1 gp7 family putative phage head morphogenesis protein